MVKHLWERALDMANMMGLISGGAGLVILGQQVQDSSLIHAGGISLSIFFVLLAIMVILMIRDIIALFKPKKKK